MHELWAPVFSAFAAFLIAVRIPALRDPLAGDYCSRCGKPARPSPEEGP